MRNTLLGAFCALLLVVSLGSTFSRVGDFTCINPSSIRSFALGWGTSSYAVSPVQKFVITDVVPLNSTGSNFQVLVNGAIVLAIDHEQFVSGSTAARVPSEHFVAGIVCPPGSVITLAGTTPIATICGYVF